MVVCSCVRHSRCVYIKKTCLFSFFLFLFLQARGLVLPHQLTLGADEYLCLQAVHALTTAVSNSSGGGGTPLEEAAGGQGVYDDTRGGSSVCCSRKFEMESGNSTST